MTEEMLKAYLKDKGLLIYGNITKTVSSSDKVICKDISSNNSFAKQHIIPVMDIVVWQSEKINELASIVNKLEQSLIGKSQPDKDKTLSEEKFVDATDCSKCPCLNNDYENGSSCNLGCRTDILWTKGKEMVTCSVNCWLSEVVTHKGDFTPHKHIQAINLHPNKWLMTQDGLVILDN